MRLKTEWLPHLHEFRRREIEIVFGRCPDGLFGSGLEVGAGDGFQSLQLARYVRRLVATDHAREILDAPATRGVRREVCDAEGIGARFAGESFDLIFSSNLLEHLPDARGVLVQMRGLLAEQGVTVHIMPGPFWKLCHLALHYPNRLALVAERIARRGGAAAALRKLREPERRSGVDGREHNNPSVARGTRPFFRRLLVPDPHGAEPTHLRELLAFRRARWRRELESAGFEVAAVRKGPVASGYGFGLDRTRRLLERLGVASVFIYVAVRKGARPQCLDYLLAPPVGE